MAPLTDEPDAIRVILVMARRKALYNLVVEITKYMRSQLELQHDSNTAGQVSGDEPHPPPYSQTAEASPGDAAQQSSESGTQSLSNRSLPTPTSPALIRLRKAALLHFDSWRTQTLGSLKEIAAKADDQKIIDARRKRAERNAKRVDVSHRGGDLLTFDTEPNPSNPVIPQKSKELDAFQSLYHPIPTRLTTIPLRDREEVMSAMLLLLLSAGSYSSYSRALCCYIASALEIPPSTLDKEEREVATTMVGMAQEADADKAGMSAEAEAQKRREENKAGRYWKVGLASVAGAAVVGVTGGLAAPVVAAAVGGIMSSVGLGALAGFLGIFWMNGALVGTLFGAFGAKMTGEMVDRYAKEVEDFKFLPLSAEWGVDWVQNDQPDARRLRVTIGINGWLEDEDDVTKPWRVLGDESEVFALRYEMSSLVSLGEKLRSLVGSAAWSAVRAEILKRTVLATLSTALWPIFLLHSASSIDNPFSFARNRSEKAGRILADALINRVQGERPITLVGYSLGARVIYSCLRVLAERKAFGIVDTVVLIGAPVPSSHEHWQMMRSVVAGKLFNVHSENDYILGFLYRGTSLQLGIAGLQAVGMDIEGVEDLDLSEQVSGHLRYPALIAQILHRCGFPGVKGGEKPIEKEKMPLDNEIQLRDSDWAEMGTLIDVGDPDGDNGPKPLLPSRHTVREMENEKFDPFVKNVNEQKTDARTLDLRLKGSGSSASKSAPDRIDGVSHDANIDLGDTQPRSSSIPQRHASVDQGGVASDSGEDSDEYEKHGITMADNEDDGELTIVEPLSIDDEDGIEKR